MAGFKVKIEYNKFNEVIRKMPLLADDAVQAIAYEGERMVKESFRDTLKRPDGVSAPGNPPAIQDANLINSINIAGGQGTYKRQIRTGVSYAKTLEYGTRYMAARPFMQPMAKALALQAPHIMHDIIQAIEDI